jgi:hypothetical protein
MKAELALSAERVAQLLSQNRMLEDNKCRLNADLAQAKQLIQALRLVLRAERSTNAHVPDGLDSEISDRSEVVGLGCFALSVDNEQSWNG